MPLVKRILAFAISYFFQYGTYYCYKYNPDSLKGKDEANFLPRIENFTFEIVSSKQRFDELVAEGLNFDSYEGGVRYWLDKGAIVFCIFIERELAHTGYVCLSEKAQASLELPYKVDYSNNEASTGGNVTNPKYRRMGLHTYCQFETLQFLRERGITTERIIISKSNVASQRTHAKFDYKIHAEAQYLKILWWQSWKERPLRQTG